MFSYSSISMLLAFSSKDARDFKVLFIFDNGKKLYGAKSGKYGDRGIITALFLGNEA